MALDEKSDKVASALKYLLNEKNTTQRKEMAAFLAEADPSGTLGIQGEADLVQLQLVAGEKAPETLRQIVKLMMADRSISFSQILGTIAESKKTGKLDPSKL